MPSLREKIAQMLIVGFEGSESYGLEIHRWLKEDNLGGVILFDYSYKTQSYQKNILNEKQVIELNQSIKNSYQKYHPHTLKPWFAIDCEGGVVNRLSKINGAYPSVSPYALSEISSMQRMQYINAFAAYINHFGFNLNFAPVVDLNLNNEAGIIGKLQRSYSDCPYQMAEFAKIWVEVFNAHQVHSCYKHFPGHGSAIGDTHLDLVDVTKTFHTNELIPYQILSKTLSQTMMVMTAHVINQNLEKTPNLPATMSYEILTNLLRHQYGYQGIIISDDLQMKALSAHYSLEEILVKTINAGCDMLIIGNQLDYIEAPAVVDAIQSLVLKKEIPVSRIDDAYKRQLEVKASI